jgi:antitoxin ParD1/3/4
MPIVYHPYLDICGAVMMPTRNVVLTDRQADMVEKLVDTGRYQNASEVLREGLRLLERQEAEDKAKLKALRDAAKIGIDAITAGQYREFDDEASLREHLGAIAKEVVGRRQK